MVRGLRTFRRVANLRDGNHVGDSLERDCRPFPRFAPVALMWLLVVGAAGVGVYAQQHGEKSSQGGMSPHLAPPVQPVVQRSDFTLKEGVREGTPEKVIIVVHRLSSWKLLAWLAQNKARSITASENEILSQSNAHTNIVVGCILDDGRTVIARLPQAETEVETLSVSPKVQQGTNPAEADEINLMVVRRDGGQVKAKFVGLDSATGLSLLRVDDSLLSASAHPAKKAFAEVEPTISAPGKIFEVTKEKSFADQAVRLFAPERIGKAETNVDTVYMRLGEYKGEILYTRGTFSERRAPQVSVSSHHPPPAINGAVALSTAGEFVGIVEQIGASGNAYLMPSSIVHQAARRVLALRASVPQPWLGASGDTVAMTTLANLTSRGWPRQQASELMHRGQGVLLTAVPPGTPAASAGLRAGDVVTRIGGHLIRSVDDFSQLLRQANTNASIEFTVWRAKSAPHAITVKLSEAFDPVKATKMAQQLAEDDGTPRTLHPTSPAKDYAKDLVGLGFEAVTMLAAKTAPQPSAPSSLLVTSVRPESAAAFGGLRPGDLIVSVNGKALTEIKPTENPFAQPASSFVIGVVRNNHPLTLKLSPRPADSTKRK